MKNQFYPPVTFSQLIKKLWFWLIFGSLTSFTIGFMIIQATLYIWFPQWKPLPPLPNGETAHRFNEVRVRDSIDVVTDQGHFYRCRLLVPGSCWIPIPREGLQQVPYDESEQYPMPRPRLGARAVSLFYHAHHFDYEVFMTAIRRDGQVDILDQDFISIFTYPNARLFFTSMSLIPGLMAGLIIHPLVNRRRK